MEVNLRKICEDVELAQLDALRNTPVAKALAKICDFIAGQANRNIRENPQINCVDVKSDLRYKVGIIDVAEFLRDLPERAAGTRRTDARRPAEPPCKCG